MYQDFNMLATKHHLFFECLIREATPNYQTDQGLHVIGVRSSLNIDLIITAKSAA